MFKYLIIFIVAAYSSSGLCNLPPTTTVTTGDPSPVTTFKTDYDGIPLTRTGTTTKIGTIPISKGGTGAVTQNFVDLSTNQTIVGDKDFVNAVISDDFKFNDSDFSTISTKTEISRAMATGVVSGGVLSVASGTQVNIAASELSFSIYSTLSNIANPLVKDVSCPLITHTVTNLASTSVWLLVDDTCSVSEVTSPPTPQQRRTYAIVGKVLNLAGAVNSVSTIPDLTVDTNSQYYDFLDALGAFNVSGNKVTAAGGNLKINRSAGVIWRRSANYPNDVQNPHQSTTTGSTPQTFLYLSQNAIYATGQTDIDVTHWDNAGTVSLISAAPAPTGTSASVNHRVYMFASGLVAVQYGQVKYASLANAIDGIANEAFILNPQLQDGGILIAIITCQRNATDLSDTSRCNISYPGRFDQSGVTAGSNATTNMQQAYNNSVTPQVTTDSTRGSIDFKRGSAADTDNVLRIQNGSGSATATITGAGVIAGSNLSGTNTGDLLTKAQSDAGTRTTNELRVPNKLLTNVGTGIDLNETGNKNILTNPSFEHLTFSTGWSNAVGAWSSISTSIDGAQAAQINASSNAVSTYQDSTLYQAQLADGVQCIAMIRVKTSVSGIYVSSRQAGTTSSTNRVSVNADGKWGLYKVPFICGGTSNGIAVHSDGVSVTGDINIDDAFVGAVDLKQDINVVGAWTIFTPTGSWTTNTTYAGKYRQVGENLEVTYLWTTSGAPTSASLSLNLPSGFTIDTSKLAGSTIELLMGEKGVARDSGTNSYEIAGYYKDTSSIYVTINNAASTYLTNGSSVTQAVPFTWGAADSGTLKISVPVTQFSGASSVYSSQCGANCVDTFSAKVSVTGVVSDENIDWINGNGTLSGGGSSNTNLTFNTGIFTVAPNCTVSADGGVAGDNVIINATSSTGVSTRGYTTPTPTNATKAFIIRCSKQGADFVATRTIQGSFLEVMTTPGVQKPKTCVVISGGAGSLASPTVCTSGTCVEYFDNCNTASTAWSSTGNTTTTWAAGTWAANVPVWCGTTSKSASALTSYDFAPVSADASGGFSYPHVAANTSGTPVNAYKTQHCTGQAP